MNISKADERYFRYFKQDVLERGAAYVVSDASSVLGMFSFLFNENEATFDFPYCVHKNAIELAFQTFMNDYPNVQKVKCLSRQKLDYIGFKNQEFYRD